ncbi:hypothetical protein, partial [Prevotella sp.]|uniref:hypothetical protein n=1 Tax=Prevotella sp. TaxID=59823 RepID=UPI00307873AC
TNYLCYVPVLEDSKGAGRTRLTRLIVKCGCKGSVFSKLYKVFSNKNQKNVFAEYICDIK